MRPALHYVSDEFSWWNLSAVCVNARYILVRTKMRSILAGSDDG